jgi:hypothetical protein
MSYNGKAVFGLLGDYDVMTDIDEFASYLEDAVSELQPEPRPARVAAE